MTVSVVVWVSVAVAEKVGVTEYVGVTEVDGDGEFVQSSLSDVPVKPQFPHKTALLGDSDNGMVGTVPLNWLLYSHRNLTTQPQLTQETKHTASQCCGHITVNW